MAWFILGIVVSIICYFIWAWADFYLFTYLGEVETCAGIEKCYMYDTLSISARIVCFLCGTAAIAIFILTWAAIFSIIIL